MPRKALLAIALFVIAAIVLASFFREAPGVPGTFPVLDADEIGDAAPPGSDTELATFGSGCFWCTEAVFLQLRGVQQVVSGYSGGHVANPTYKQVTTGTTG